MSAPLTPDARMDWSRDARTGLPEAVYAKGKTDPQLAQILREAQALGRPLLLTRLSPEQVERLPPELAAGLDYEEVSRTGLFGPVPAAEGEPDITIVAAGLADMPAVGEAMRTLAFCGVGARVIADVGVAGLWRLMDRLEEIRRARIVIAVAGMEGALFSVLAGLIRAPLIAVPTSVGQGISEGGTVALHSALASCAPGLVVVNIDNGFGAAQAAMRMRALALPARADAS